MEKFHGNNINPIDNRGLRLVSIGNNNSFRGY
jgi:hypothetical protein